MGVWSPGSNGEGDAGEISRKEGCDLSENHLQEMTEGDLHTHAVTHGQFSAYLVAKAPEKPCPECGVNDWGTNTRDPNDNSNSSVLQVAFTPGWHTTRVMPLHTLHCLNCGFTKFFAATIVKRWVDEHASS